MLYYSIYLVYLYILYVVYPILYIYIYIYVCRYILIFINHNVKIVRSLVHGGACWIILPIYSFHILMTWQTTKNETRERNKQKKTD